MNPNEKIIWDESCQFKLCTTITILVNIVIVIKSIANLLVDRF